MKNFLLIISAIAVLGTIAYFFSPLGQVTNSFFLNNIETTKFVVQGEELHMNGAINSKTYQQFVNIIEQNSQITTLVEVDVAGSLDDETMIKMAYKVRQLGLNTKLLSDSKIYSGGVDLFLAGVERSMAEGAIIGVHSWSDGIKDAADYPKDAPEHEANRKYIEDMLGSDEFYWFTIYAAPAEGMHEMSQAEIEKYALLTQEIQ